MTRFNVRHLLLIAAICALSSSVASAQTGRSRIQYPLGRPTVSPYLNLLGSSYGAGINYYGLVRPQQQFYQQAEDLKQGVYTRHQRTSQAARPGQPLSAAGSHAGYRLGTTGHATSFRVLGNVQQQPQQSGGLSSPAAGLNSPGGGSGGTLQGRSQTGFSGHSAAFGYGAAYGGQQNQF